MTICTMRITTVYFGPAELKNLNSTTSCGPTVHVTHCHSAWQTIALVANGPNCNCLMYIQLRLILWILITGSCTRAAIHQCKLQCITRRQSPKLQLSYSKCVFETSRFTSLYQLTITLKYFKYELSLIAVSWNICDRCSFYFILLFYMIFLY